MARRFLTDVDLVNFALRNIRVDPVAGTPSGLGVSHEGRVWWDTAAKRLMVWDGTGAVDLLDLAAATGTITASKVSDFTTAVRAISWGTLADPTGPVDVGGQRLTAVADPTVATDGATRGWVEAQLAGLSSGQVLKGAVRVAATTNVTLSNPGGTIDGVNLVNGDIVLLTGQTNAAQNGPYRWTGATNPLERAANWDTTQEAALGSYWIVREGNNAETFAMLTNDGAITLDTTSLTFAFRGQQTPSALDGLVFSGGYSVGEGVGINVTTDAVGIDTARVPRKWVGGIPNATGPVDDLPITVTGAQVQFNHGANNSSPLVVVRYGATPPSGGTAGALVEVDDVIVDANNVRITLPEAPAAGQYTFMLVA